MGSIGARPPLFIWPVIALVTVLQAGCSDSSSDRLSAIPQETEALCDTSFTRVLHSVRCGPRFGEVRVFEDEAEWCRFWDQVHGCAFPPPACDRSLIDFDRDVALLVAIGLQPNGCYDVEVSCVRGDDASDDTLVFGQETVPGENCSCPLESVTPFDVVKVDRPIDRARLELERTIDECE